MLKILFTHYLKSLFRSTRFDGNLVLKIVFASYLFYVCSLIFSLGVNFAGILYKFQPLEDPVKLFNGYLFYLIPIDFLLRFLFQKNNFRLANSYMHLPVNRGKIIFYIMAIKLFNIFNLFLILFVFPFSWINILPEYGWLSFILYLLTFLCIMIFMTYFTFLLKNLSYNKYSFVFVPVLWFMLAFILKLICRTDPGVITAGLFSDILTGNYLIIISIVLIIGSLILLNISLVKNLIYNTVGENGRQKINFRIPAKSILNKTGNSYIVLEISLLLRNRRIRSLSIIVVYLIILTYFVFLLKPIKDIFTIFVWYLFLSGVWGYTYLQFAFSYESSFFDFISTLNFDFNRYIKTKYVFILIISILTISSVLPVIIIKNHDLHAIMTAFLFNIGFGNFLVFLTATFNKDRIDLNNSLIFNYQGINLIQLFSISATMMLPLFFLGIITLFLSLRYRLYHPQYH